MIYQIKLLSYLENYFNQLKASELAAIFQFFLGTVLPISFVHFSRFKPVQNCLIGSLVDFILNCLIISIYRNTFLSKILNSKATCDAMQFINIKFF